jgi:hypothetical protein
MQNPLRVKHAFMFILKLSGFFHRVKFGCYDVSVVLVPLHRDEVSSQMIYVGYVSRQM